MTQIKFLGLSDLNKYRCTVTHVLKVHYKKRSSLICTELFSFLKIKSFLRLCMFMYKERKRTTSLQCLNLDYVQSNLHIQNLSLNPHTMYHLRN